MGHTVTINFRFTMNFCTKWKNILVMFVFQRHRVKVKVIRSEIFIRMFHRLLRALSMDLPKEKLIEIQHGVISRIMFMDWKSIKLWALGDPRNRMRNPFSLLSGKSVVTQKFWTPNSWKLLVLAGVLVWLFNHFQQNFHNKRDKVTPTPTVLTVGEPKNVWPNSFPATKVYQTAHLYHNFYL